MLTIKLRNNSEEQNPLDVEIGQHSAEIKKVDDGYSIELSSKTNQSCNIKVEQYTMDNAFCHMRLVDYCLEHFKDDKDLEFKIACLMKEHGCRSEIALYEVLFSHL